ncbi:MAG: FtsX-like permease family protein, partial [Gemmatimonadetes bacterium]|nr:FtsX-like permease family protein [Gemmatimonadota bacterium]
MFRALLRLYPDWFTEQHGDEMLEFLRARLARAPSAAARIRTWLGGAADVVRSAWAIRRSGLVDGKRRQAGPNGRPPQQGGGGLHMENWLQDLRHTVRHLTRSPGFTIGATLLLAVGLGANITVFSLVDALLFRPPPWDEPDRVVYVYQDSDEGEPSSSSFPAYRDMTDETVFAHVAATSPSSGTLERDGAPIPVETEFTTASMMSVLGLSPARGRWFDPEHDEVGSEMVAVISHPTWISAFGADPAVVGSTVRLNGQPVTVIGVGPEGLSSSFPPFVTDFWLSISTTPIEGAFRVANLDRRSDHWYQIRARLAPGVTVSQATSAMNAFADRLARGFPEFNRGRGVSVFPARDVRATPGQDAQLFQMGTLLSAVVATVLLLACANLANLLLVRGLTRSGEMAVRRAMGAGSARVARLFLLEATTLAAVGGALGLLLTVWAIGAFPSTPLAGLFPGAMDLRVDVRVMLYAMGLVLVTGALFGLVPALRAARRDVAGSLRDDGRGVSLDRGGRRLRNALV